MLLKRLMVILLVLVVLFVFVVPSGITKGDDEQSSEIITVNDIGTYKSKSGETYPIIIFNGKKCIV